MIIILVILTLLLAGLLAIASFHAGKMQGIKHWASANVFIGLGFFLILTENVSPYWSMVISMTLFAFGQSLQFSGIQLFKYGYCNYKFPLIVTLIGLVQTWFFNNVVPDSEIRAMLNSLLLAFINGMCAKELLIRIQQPLRTAYWLSGMSFALLTGLFLIRFIDLVFLHFGHFTLFTVVPINFLMFSFGSVTQLVITFGFVLMMNYTLASKLEQLAQTDELTGVLNRRALFEVARKVCAQFSRSGNNISILMLDIDHFKNINDLYGHPVGDEVLRQFANIARSLIRDGDYIGRYGGEEFCVLLPDTSVAEAKLLAERLRQYYAEIVVAVVNARPVHSTVSIGIADSHNIATDFELLIKAADNALLQAKVQGRNRVCIAYEVSEESADLQIKKTKTNLL